jgi:hypothetical protein
MKRCPKTMDKPILIFGLEPEDIAALGLMGGLLSLFNTLVSGAVFFGGWIFLVFAKRDKPAGYVIHLLYKMGVNFPGLLSPQIKRYSPAGSGKARKTIL